MHSGQIDVFSVESVPEAPHVHLKHKAVLIQAAEKATVVKVEHGQVYVQDEDVLTAHSLLEGQKKAADGDAAQSQGAEASSLQESQDTGVTVAYKPPATPIDPSKVTIRDLEMYEDLMKGQAVPAISNITAAREIGRAHV